MGGGARRAVLLAAHTALQCTQVLSAARPSPQVYTEPLSRRHYAGLFSVATIFRIVILLAAIGASLVIAYASGGFWVKVKPTLDQATVHYTQDALLVFTASAWVHGAAGAHGCMAGL